MMNGFFLALGLLAFQAAMWAGIYGIACLFGWVP
jgi:hypothetical protein